MAVAQNKLMHELKRTAVLAFSVAAIACQSHAPAPLTAQQAAPREISQPEAEQLVGNTWRSWCDALIGIATTAKTGGDARAQADKVLSTAYAYDTGPVLFKPTLTTGEQTFRFDKKGALAYFVGGDPAYPDDHGFALKGWTECRPELKQTMRQGDVLLSMGNVHLANGDGTRVSVNKTFGYQRQPDGALKIILHHSSLPAPKN